MTNTEILILYGGALHINSYEGVSFDLGLANTPEMKQVCFCILRFESFSLSRLLFFFFYVNDNFLFLFFFSYVYLPHSLLLLTFVRSPASARSHFRTQTTHYPEERARHERGYPT